MEFTRIAGAVALAFALAAPAAAEPSSMPTTTTSETTAMPEMPVNPGSVARAQFTMDVVDREPTDEVTRLTNDQQKVFFFTELQQFQGQELVHRWELGDEVKAEVPFAVNGPRWRVFSSKALEPSWLGTWTVSVIDADGNVVEKQSFDYVEAPQATAATQDEESMQPGPAAPAE